MLTIKKERRLSQRIQILKALVRRLPPNHPRLLEIKAELGRSLAGFKGEESIDYYLDLLTDLKCEYLIFHDIRLPYKEYFFQIDTLILFPNFFLVLEVKNIAGTLHFDHAFQQLIRTLNKDGVEEKTILDDPIVQVQRQLSQIKRWFKLNKQSPIPGECLVVMTNPNSQIIAKSHATVVEKHIIRSSILSLKIEELYKKYPKEMWTKKDLRKISTQLLKGTEPSPIFNILEKYGITKSELLKGVHCPKCEQLAMKRLRGRWRCHHCKFISCDAHIDTLKDYRLLINSSITNSEIREFLEIKNETTARRLLKSLNVPHKGKTNKRRYFLEFIYP